MSPWRLSLINGEVFKRWLATEFKGLKKNLALANPSLKNFGDEAKNLASEIGALHDVLAVCCFSPPSNGTFPRRGRR